MVYTLYHLSSRREEIQSLVLLRNSAKARVTEFIGKSTASTEKELRPVESAALSLGNLLETILSVRFFIFVFCFSFSKPISVSTDLSSHENPLNVHCFSSQMLCPCVRNRSHRVIEGRSEIRPYNDKLKVFYKLKITSNR